MEEDIDVITFDEPSTACWALYVPQAIDAQGCIGLLDAGVLERTSDGRVPMSDVRQAQAALVGPLFMHMLDGPRRRFPMDPHPTTGHSSTSGSRRRRMIPI